MGALDGKRVAFLVANEGVEQVELTEPWQAVQEAGGTPVLLAPRADEPVQAMKHLDPSDQFEPDLAVRDAAPTDFDGLVLPGGVANPDQLRTDDDAVGFVRSFADSGRPLAVICHGPWTLVEAGVVRDRTLTSWPSVRTDLENAGATWVDEPVVRDGTLISSRKPDDLPAFCEALVDALSA